MSEENFGDEFPNSSCPKLDNPVDPASWVFIGIVIAIGIILCL